MKRLKKQICRVIKHVPIRMSVGMNYIEVCYRCGSVLEVHEEDSQPSDESCCSELDKSS